MPGTAPVGLNSTAMAVPASAKRAAQRVMTLAASGVGAATNTVVIHGTDFVAAAAARRSA